MTKQEWVEYYKDALGSVLEFSTQEDKAEGMRWYADAHMIAKGMAIAYKTPADKVAAIMSCLSVGVRWDICIASTDGLLKAFHYDRDLPTIATYGHQLEKAHNIIASTESGRELLPLIATKVGRKTRNFYLNILDPEDPHPVTLDRWMWRISGRHQTVMQYGLYAEAVRHVARLWDIRPCELQAIAWITIRRENNSG